jgi:YbbR domain-containing protein
MTVDVILAGPLPILTTLQPLDVRVVLDLAGLLPGEYTVAPRVEIIPLGVTIESVVPGLIEVTVAIAPTPTPTPLVTPIPLPTPTPTETPF